MENITGLDRILKNTEFENLQQLKAIENEKEKIQAYQNRIEECEGLINKLTEEITLHEEQAAKLNRQSSINKDNIDSLKQTSIVLGEHEDALKKKLQHNMELVEIERLQQTGASTKYRAMWLNYEATYNSMDETRGTKQKRQEIDFMSKKNKALEVEIKELEMELEAIQMRKDERKLLIPWVVDIATLRVETNKNLASIQNDELMASRLTAKIKQLEKERIEKLQAQQQARNPLETMESYPTKSPFQLSSQEKTNPDVSQHSKPIDAPPQSTSSKTITSTPRYRLELPQLSTITRKDPGGRVSRNVMDKLELPSSTSIPPSPRPIAGSGFIENEITQPQPQVLTSIASVSTKYKPSPLQFSYTQPSPVSQMQTEPIPAPPATTHPVPSLASPEADKEQSSAVFKVPTSPLRQRIVTPTKSLGNVQHIKKSQKGVEGSNAPHQNIPPSAKGMEWENSTCGSPNYQSVLVPTSSSTNSNVSQQALPDSGMGIVHRQLEGNLNQTVEIPPPAAADDGEVRQEMFGQQFESHHEQIQYTEPPAAQEAQQHASQPDQLQQSASQDFPPNNPAMFAADKGFSFGGFGQDTGNSGFGGNNSGFGGGFGSGFFGGQQDTAASSFNTGFSFGDNSSQGNTGFSLNFGNGSDQPSGFSMFNF